MTALRSNIGSSSAKTRMGCSGVRRRRVRRPRWPAPRVSLVRSPRDPRRSRRIPRRGESCQRWRAGRRRARRQRSRDAHVRARPIHHDQPGVAPRTRRRSPPGSPSAPRRRGPRRRSATPRPAPGRMPARGRPARSLVPCRSSTPECAAAAASSQQRRLGVSPPHVGARHDPPAAARRRASARPVQRLPVRRRRGGRLCSAPGLLVVGLAEHVVHREVDERHTRRRPSAPRPAARRRSARRRRPATAGRGVPGQRRDERHVVDLLQRPLPHRSAGARPPRISIGDWFCCAAAIALMPLVTPGPRSVPRPRAPWSPSTSPRPRMPAVCSWRVSISRMPSARSRRRSRTGAHPTA